jgi:hypothetical protein
VAAQSGQIVSVTCSRSLSPDILCQPSAVQDRSHQAQRLNKVTTVALGMASCSHREACETRRLEAGGREKLRAQPNVFSPVAPIRPTEENARDNATPRVRRRMVGL